jgi:anti-sigma factor ChrR (cupin superfamily)
LVFFLIKTHAFLDEDSKAQATLFALGALSSEETTTFEGHLESCPACRREVAELRRLNEMLALVAEPVRAPAAVRRNLLAYTQGQGFYLLRRDEGPWRPAGPPGVDMRILFIDHEAERQTLLLRMAPGASFPCHRHDDGFEECLVLEGDVADGHAEMQAGDFVRYPADTEHGPLTTVRGNLLLITSGLHEAA